MSRATTFFLILSLLLVLSSARPEPTIIATKAPSKDVEVEEGCVGIGEEECLMRRTLVAHLDYIYTQKKNP
ncbi:putative phytosulfokine [Helianthus annuus]|uniref:Phytosulfokine n=1 Tax=Helianthus annuus TaxID=4232 RepID=A0A251U7P9_HELAN|nr:putative phytosulfokine [Helianthus annuus]KAJ0454543.1 putative phytosulfokine [Helianthus annuus]KAJ0472249.1 putative phytosulfokine [Helianthus annuus]KAJ0638708.1 putative phytosulfokine [Helianthus annuus]KAJ0647847.1 putative phytosulfokine [Helianthus annuus]